MAEMQDLNHTPILVDLVGDENPPVDQLAHPRIPASGAPHLGEHREQIDAIEQSLAKAGSDLVVVLGYMAYDLGQVG
jgi:hypothetical protein